MSENKPPTWIADALAAAVCSIGRMRDAEPEALTRELATRFPIDEMVRAACRALAGVIGDGQTERDLARDVTAAIVDALTTEPDALDLTASHQRAARVLDVAGVPYADDTAERYKIFDLADRVTWLAQQRPIGARADQDIAKIAEQHAKIGDLTAELIEARRLCGIGADELIRERAEREQDRIAGLATAAEDLRTINGLRAELRSVRPVVDAARGAVDRRMLKHGPGMHGGDGPCDEHCIKCEIDRMADVANGVDHSIEGFDLMNRGDAPGGEAGGA